MWHSFAKYNYRSAEDILEAAKPLCHAEKVTLTLADEVVNIGNFNYIKTTAMLTDGEDTRLVTAFAREEETKKGMDASQITGAASSYARKYALNGLFAIDDTKDSDGYDNTKLTTQKPKPTGNGNSNPATEKQRNLIKDQLAGIGVSLEDTPGYLIENFGVAVPLTVEGASFVISELKENK